MKTRVIHTRIWKDSYFSTLNRAEKILFLYLITNENINMSGIYEVTDKEIIIWTDLNQQELDKAKTKLSEDNKFLFKNGWVKVINHQKYNSYGKGEKQEEAYKKELLNIPDFMRNNTSMDTSIDGVSILDLNHNTENIIHKTENKKQKREEINLETLQRISEKYEVPLKFVEDCWDSAQNWLISKGKIYKDYEAFLSNWVKRERAALIIKSKQSFQQRGGVADARGL